MVISRITDELTQATDALGDRVSGVFLEPVVRLGVTGLSRAGKTVFITSLVANLMDRARMPGLLAAAEGRIEAAFLQPQPDDTVPRFEYEAHLDTLSGGDPHWPESTRSVSELRLSLRVRPAGLLSGFQGPRTVHLDIVDYPGEWLLDLELLEMDYRGWSADVLERMTGRPGADSFLAAARAAQGRKDWDATSIGELSDLYTRYLMTARDAGFAGIGPGRFLLPGELEGSPVVTFAPLPPEHSPPRRGLWREMERRFDAYRRKVVRPFFRDHFARIDRQVVLVDTLGAIHSGPPAVADLQDTMTGILSAFRPGRNPFLARLLRGRRVERILFAATKADHLHHSQHGRLSAIMEAMMRRARDRADFAGARTGAMAIASLRATTEETRRHGGQTLDCVRGRLLDDGRQAAFHPGALPEDPRAILDPARQGHAAWLDQEFGAMNFAPARITLRPGEGPPHIRLDRAAQFLIGDRL